MPIFSGSMWFFIISVLEKFAVLSILVLDEGLILSSRALQECTASESKEIFIPHWTIWPANITVVWLSDCAHGHRNLCSNVNMQGLWFCWFSDKGCTSPSMCFQAPTNGVGVLFFTFFSWTLGKIKSGDLSLNSLKAELSCVTRNMQTKQLSPWHILWKNHSLVGELSASTSYMPDSKPGS